MLYNATLLIDTLSLAVYAEDNESLAILEKVLDILENETSNDTMLNSDISKFYIDLLHELVKEHELKITDADIAALFMKIELDPILKDYPDVLERIKEIFENKNTVTEIKIKELKQKIKRAIVVMRGNKELKKLFRISTKMISTTDSKEQGNLYVQMLEHIENLDGVYRNNPFDTNDSSIDMINMSDANSVGEALRLFKTKRKGNGYRLGLQALERMFGEPRGPLRGRFIGLAGCSHHFKTGMMLAFTRWIAMYNAPRGETGKPTAIVFVSLENEIYENMMMWFYEAYVNIFKKAPDGLSDQEIIEKINNIFSKNGFTVLVYREEADLFGWDEWKALHDKISSKYEIEVSVLDYMGLMKLPDNAKNNQAKELQNLAGKFKTYGERNMTMVITGLQLNGAAEELAASGERNIVKRFGAAHLADSKSIKKELAVLIFLFIEENHLGQRYLTAKLDKLKYEKMPPLEDRYMAVKFTQYGLMDDIFIEDSSVKDIYNVVAADHSEGSIKTAVF